MHKDIKMEFFISVELISAVCISQAWRHVFVGHLLSKSSTALHCQPKLLLYGQVNYVIYLYKIM